MRHVIITRSGIGVVRPSFYRQRIALLRAGLHKCLSAQTNQNFEWVIAVDCHIDEESRYQFLSLCADHPNFRVIEVDPIKNGSLSPSAEQVLGAAGSDPVAVSRLDDDDLLHTSWTSVMSAALREHTGPLPASIAIEHGLDLSPADRLFRHFHHPTTPVGITLICPGSDPIDIFKHNHNRLHEKVAAMGGTTRIIAANEPLWIYVRHPESETSEHRKRKLKHYWKVDGRRGGEFWSTLHGCGISGDWPTEIVQRYSDNKDLKPPLVGLPTPRMVIKRSLLRALAELPKGDSRYNAIVNAFYAI